MPQAPGSAPQSRSYNGGSPGKPGSAPKPPEHLVVGAGVSGLYAALLLARSGKRVRVIERGARPGGLAGAEHFRGIPCDLGSHRLHPAALSHPLFREIHRAEPLLARPRRGVLLLGAERLPYPPTAAALLRAMGPRRSLAILHGLLRRGDRRRALSTWDGDRGAGAPDADIGFERFVHDRVGDAAYRAFYEPYAEKVWGIDPAALSQVVAKKRVSSTEPWAILRAFAGQALARARGAAGEGIDDHFYYPARGISSITDYLVARLGELGVPIEMGRAYEPGEHTEHAGHAGPVLFAGDLAALVPTALEHRGVYLVFMALPGSRLGSAETYYAPERGYWFGRVSELQNYSPALRARGETILCVEIPEGAWGRDVDFGSGDRLAALRDQLARAGIVPRAVTPLETRQRFVPGVYPLYRRGWLTEWRATMRRVAQLGNVIPFGRQALFLHCNLDHCATIAADAVAHLEAKRSPEAWIERAADYLEIRVRD